MKLPWRLIAEYAPELDGYGDERRVLVYQPAVKYVGGATFPPYLTFATRGSSGKFYSEECNTYLEPTHFVPEDELWLPDTRVVKSPYLGPTRHGLLSGGWGSESVAEYSGVTLTDKDVKK